MSKKITSYFSRRVTSYILKPSTAVVSGTVFECFTSNNEVKDINVCELIICSFGRLVPHVPFDLIQVSLLSALIQILMLLLKLLCMCWQLAADHFCMVITTTYINVSFQYASQKSDVFFSLY